MPQRFLLREIWERLDLDVAAGVRFAKNDPNVVAFRQLLLHKVVQILRWVGFSPMESANCWTLNAFPGWTCLESEPLQRKKNER